MAWLRLTHDNGREIFLNTDQVIHIRSGASHSGSDISSEHGMGYAHETIEEIAAMIADAERRERLDGIFKAIVYNFPHGYDPGEIVETARRLLDALDKPREV